MNVEIINPFIESSKNIISSMCSSTVSMDKPHLRTNEFELDEFVISLGITGEYKGEIFFSMKRETAKNIASKMMMGMQVEELDELAKSAICELTNMIVGNALTIFSKKNIIMDTTPPKAFEGTGIKMYVPDARPICIPLSLDDGSLFEINISTK